MSEKTRQKRKLAGIVVSDVNDKTIVVKVQRRFKHKLYNKFINATKKYHAHDSENKGKLGDAVIIVESRPHSKMKKWELLNIETKMAEASL